MPPPPRRKAKPKQDLDTPETGQSRFIVAIGVILSGTSSDGTRGLEAIKSGGGITFAQEAKSAKYDYMPRSAIAAGVVDFVLPSEKIARELIRISRHPLLAVPSPAQPEELPVAPGGLEAILPLLYQATGVDFSQYERSTLNRRILRRLVIHRLDSLEAYVAFLKKTPAEVAVLAEDLFIKVTSFFRDPDAFEVLKNKFFPAIIADKSPGDAIRVWVPGCSTGEEAYSLAICWLEFLGDRGTANPIQIFATDVSGAVIDKARTGLYPENIVAEVSLERLNRFFTKTESGYEVKRNLREMCIFAKHNLLHDPPFSRLDLISFRNVLIYLNQEAQKRLIHVLHYALSPTGFLMLGSSESIGSSPELFTLEDKRWKIYLKKYLPGTAKLDLIAPRLPVVKKETPKGLGGREEKALRKMDLFQEADRYVTKNYGPAGVVINENWEILQFRGETDLYLKPAAGEASFNLMKRAREGLTAGLHSAVQEALKNNRKVKKESLRLESEGRIREIDAEIVPLKPGPSKERFFLVLFEERRVTPPETAEQAGREPVARDKLLIRQLREELAATKEYLQSVIEDLETSNEELRAANVETLSVNEEFQSVNEELETAKEELQSANEELSTMNDELQNRLMQLEESRHYAQTVVEAMRESIVLLNRDLRVKLANPFFYETFQVSPQDTQGRIFYELGNRQWDIPELREILHQASRGTSFENYLVEHDFPGIGTRAMLLNACPASQEGETELILLTIMDVTAIRHTEALRRAYVELQERTLQLEVSNDELKSFSYNMAISLKRPIRAIEGFSKMLMKEHTDKLDAEGLRLFEIITANTRHLRQIVDDLLALASLVRQAMRKSVVDLGGMAEQIFERLKGEAAGRKLQFIVKDLPLAYGDHSLLYQAITQLMDNALKFTKSKETAVIEVGGRTEGEENIYYVKDNGIGFDDQVVGNLFRSFQRLHPCMEEYEGTGVGLAMVERIIQRHGGRVWAEGKVDEGATFYLALPRNGA